MRPISLLILLVVAILTLLAKEATADKQNIQQSVVFNENAAESDSSQVAKHRAARQTVLTLAEMEAKKVLKHQWENKDTILNAPDRNKEIMEMNRPRLTATTLKPEPHNFAKDAATKYG